ncbi:Got1/Sft2-like family-domain-containing protein [Glomus cerebriforme]|uniref:Protein transport protein SFT2 n=1 Tax=Glomus cerebriforme TaxID=658196 RepID=A0A397TPG4_9GLOM|nr:Got1/Sft2-like family-domain-containing protein [Glomus cerebriforme]
MKLWDSFQFSDQGTMDETSPFDDFFKLTRTQRLYGFGICFVLGFVISLVSVFMIGISLSGFAVLYTLGNIISLVSTGFLVGFKKQIKTMFAPVRWFASVIYLGTLVLTLVIAFTLGIGILCIILCVIQWMALFWYCASYIPYGRAIIKKVFGSCVDSVV